MPENNTKHDELDKSIDAGLTQFGRFMKRRWLLILLGTLLLVYIIINIVPKLSFPSPSTLFVLAIQLLFAVLFVGIQLFAWFFFMGRPRLYWVMPGETGVGFKDYKGNPEVLEEARRIVVILRGVKEFQAMGGAPVRGLLLSGPPGTGKSYLAQCISTEAGVPFAYVSAASMRGIFLGMDVLMIKNLYRKARRLAREYGGCVVFMDELDAIATARTSQSPGLAFGGGMLGGMNMSGGLNELLMQLDPPNIETGWFKKVLRVLGLYHGRVQAQPVLTIGATNIPDTLDPALLRPGRFDRQIRVLPPTDKYRGEVIEYYLNKVKHDPNISIDALVQRMFEYTPVAIKHIINEAVIIAHFEGRDVVTYKDITAAQDKHEFGLRQLSDLTPIERRRLAYHEAGHTVACYYLLEREFPSYVTLHRHTDEAGAEAFAAWRPKETIKTRHREEILAFIKISLASRASEELFLDVNLSGVTGDFASATRLASAYIGLYGMDGTIFSYAAFANPATGVNPAIIPNFAERVESLLQKQMKEIKRLLEEHSEAVIAVAEALIERDELVADEIKQLIDEADARRVARAVLDEFEPLLGNGHSKNGTNNGVNGQTLIGSGTAGNGSGNGHRSGSLTPNASMDSTTIGDVDDEFLSYPASPAPETFKMQLPPTDGGSGMTFFMGG
jgi:ATP-dependent Zn protease